MAKGYKYSKLNIKKALQKRSLSQYELAKRLEVPAHHVTKMVRPEYNPTFKTLNKIAKAMDCQVVDLIDS